eukprot:3423608-Alexandrium_andersonii.AAC.1
MCEFARRARLREDEARAQAPSRLRSCCTARTSGSPPCGPPISRALWARGAKCSADELRAAAPPLPGLPAPRQLGPGLSG